MISMTASPGFAAAESSSVSSGSESRRFDTDIGGWSFCGSGMCISTFAMLSRSRLRVPWSV